MFIKRAQLIHEQLNENRAVLHLKKLRIKDSGMYRCIVKEGDDGDYKQVTLKVTGAFAFQNTQLDKQIHKGIMIAGNIFEMSFGWSA